MYERSMDTSTGFYWIHYWIHLVIRLSILICEEETIVLRKEKKFVSWWNFKQNEINNHVCKTVTCNFTGKWLSYKFIKKENQKPVFYSPLPIFFLLHYLFSLLFCITPSFAEHSETKNKEKMPSGKQECGCGQNVMWRVLWGRPIMHVMKKVLYNIIIPYSFHKAGKRQGKLDAWKYIIIWTHVLTKSNNSITQSSRAAKVLHESTTFCCFILPVDSEQFWSKFLHDFLKGTEYFLLLLKGYTLK